MPGVFGTVDLDLREVENGFKGMIKAGQNFKRVWRKLAPTMKEDQKEHIRLQLGPDGVWPPLAKSTKKRRNKRKIFTRKMAKGDATSVSFSRTELVVASNIEWADVHQSGGVAGKGAKIPERTFIYLSDKFIAIALPKIRDHLLRGWRK